MKHAKSFLALLLALTMALTLSIAVFADGETGTITIDNAVNGQTYTILPSARPRKLQCTVRRIRLQSCRQVERLCRQQRCQRHLPER